MTKLPMTLAVALAWIMLAAPVVRAAGQMGEAEHKDDGIRFFGFVRDANGKPVGDAKVTAEIRNSTRYVTHTGKNGMYSFGGFAKSVKPDDVTISCSTDKLQQAKVVRKTRTSGKAVKSVETECRMQAG